MKFGIFYEHQLPRPWGPDDEHRLLKDALEQVELADKLGIDYVWEVEHHFLEEYSHSSAPEVFLAAASQRT
ncbi:MAG: LLM class flavin-dependent oxidoreductase, partial [Acidimicrobiales bacterium]